MLPSRHWNIASIEGSSGSTTTASSWNALSLKSPRLRGVSMNGGHEMDALVGVEIISVVLSASIVYALFRYIPQLIERSTQRVERTEEATRRSNELRRQSDERRMEEFREAQEANRLAEEKNEAWGKRLVQMETQLISLSATYNPHSDRIH